MKSDAPQNAVLSFEKGLLICLSSHFIFDRLYFIRSLVTSGLQCNSIKFLAPLWQFIKKIARNNCNDSGTWLLVFPTDSLSPLYIGHVPGHVEIRKY